MTASKPVRLYSKGVHLGYKRNKKNQHCNQSRIQIEGVQDRKDTAYYIGKRIAYVYKAPTEKRSPTGVAGKYRVMWGRIIGAHGNAGHVRAKFRNNLPATSIGKGVRVMLYPSTI